MNPPSRPITILMAEDDPDDRLLTRDALRESRLANQVLFVEDGVELLAYLRRLGRYADPLASPTPDLVLLDLNMPRMDGREALAEIKADPRLRHIPVVVLTTSDSDEDVLRSYDSGAGGFITKPVTFDGLVKTINGVGHYWVQLVTLAQQAPEDGE